MNTEQQKCFLQKLIEKAEVLIEIDLAETNFYTAINSDEPCRFDELPPGIKVDDAKWIDFMHEINNYFLKFNDQSTINYKNQIEILCIPQSTCHGLIIPENNIEKINILLKQMESDINYRIAEEESSENPNYDNIGNNKANNVNVYGNVTGLQIQQGNNNKMQISYDNTNLNLEKVEVFLQQLNSYQDQFSREFGEKSGDLVCAIDAAQIALDSGNTRNLDKALTSIKSIVEGAAGGILATGILAGLSHLWG